MAMNPVPSIRQHNQPGSRAVDADPGRSALERRLMNQPPYILDAPRRKAVLAALLDRAIERGWPLIAAHVRSTHVHNRHRRRRSSGKRNDRHETCASRRLNQSGFDTPDRKRWARHGSTRWLRSRENIDAAIQYVIEKQGDPMAFYISER
ncbi:MAG: hypothetical protein WA213_15235 [Terriglobales bacterium]